MPKDQIHPPAVPSTLDCLCDAEQLHGLIMAAELVLDEIGDDPAMAPEEARHWRLITRQDEKTLAALLRSARQLAEKLESDLGELA